MKRKFLCSVLVLLLVLMMPLTAFAYEKPDDETESSFTVYYHHLDEAFDNVEFRVWKAADMTGAAEFTLSGGFEDYPAEITGEMTDSDWANLAELLSGYVLKDGLKPVCTGVTNKDGLYTVEGLKPGLYLVIGDSHQRVYKEGEVTRTVYYQTAPFLVSVPGLKDWEWQYDVSVSPKFSSSEKATISRRIIKVWDDKGYEGKRPASVTFDLVCDDKVADTITLSRANNWSHQWDALDNTKTWRIVEHVPDGYTVSTKTEGITYAITNTYKAPEVSKPTATPKPTTSTTTKPTTTPKQSSTTTTKLPQTGQMWWPIPVLAGAGLVLFLIGLTLYRKSRKNKFGTDKKLNLIGVVAMCLGLVLMASGCTMACMNNAESDTAGEYTEKVTKKIVQKIDESPVAPFLEEQSDEEYVPDYMIDVGRELPEAEIDGNLYVGKVEIPSQGLELSVLSEWSYPGLKLSPCRYMGTPYNGLFVICAHNYKTHFGPIKNLVEGDLVQFTDMDGNVFRYSVAEVLTIDPYTNIEDTDHDLVLFTCTLGGATRVAVYCDHMAE